MSGVEALFAGVLASAIALQALLPRYRLLVVLAGAAVAATLTTVLGTGTVPQLFAEVPWDVLLILVALGIFAELLAASNLFGLSSVYVTERSKAKPALLLLAFGVGTWAVSGVVNNLTALLMVLPVLLSVFALINVTQRYLSWCVGVILVACNLGGAATPIGDFPAVLLLGKGVMTFADYLRGALLPTLIALVILLVIVFALVRPTRDMPRSELGAALTLKTLKEIYRRVHIRWRLLLPGLGAFVLMMIGWLALPASWRIGPELVAWVGVGFALLFVPKLGEGMLRRKVDVEAALFLLALFLMVGAVKRSGLFTTVARGLLELPLSPSMQVVAFLVTAAVLTGLFSAGPSMAALLEVAAVLTAARPSEPIYIGLALSVCAGSSLFLTAATSGPLAQSLVERAGLKDARQSPLIFGFREFVPVGLIGFTVILAVAIGRTLLALR